MTDIPQLARYVVEAIKAGQSAAEGHEDGGASNLDCVMLCGLKGVREKTLRGAGIPCYRHGGGVFALPTPFGGQGNQRYAGVQAMYRSLQANGVDCYVHYQID